MYLDCCSHVNLWLLTTLTTKFLLVAWNSHESHESALQGHQSISRNWLMFMKNGLIQSGAPKRNCVQLVQKTSITMVYGTYNYNYIILFIKQLITWEAPHCKDSQYWWMTMKMKCIPITTHQKIPVYPIVLPWYSRFISVKVGLFTILDI